MGKKILLTSILLLLLITVPVQAKKDLLELEAGPVYGFFKLSDINSHLQARNNYLNNDLIYGPTSPLKYKIPESAITYFHPLKRGLGGWLRVSTWLTDQLAVGGEVEYLTLNSIYQIEDKNSTYYQEEYKLDLTGILGVIIYRIPFNKEAYLLPFQQRTLLDRVKFDFMIGLGKYRADFNWQRKMNFSGILEAGTEENRQEEYTGSQWGGKGGVEVIVPILDNLTINCGANYRQIVFDQLTNSQGQPYNSIYTGDMEPEEFDFSGWEVVSSIKLKF